MNGDYSIGGMASFVGCFMDKLGTSRFAIARNSLGGAVAVRFAESNPARVTKLIPVDVVGPSETNDRPMSVFDTAAAFADRTKAWLMPRRTILRGLNAAVANKAVLADRMIDRRLDFSRMQRERRALRMFLAAKYDKSIERHIGTLKMPVLILWGADDPSYRTAGAGYYAHALQDPKIVVYRGPGHFVQLEAPVRSAADARQFLARATP